MATPINHHYVPQHFLKAWAKNGSSDRLYRFRNISHNNRFECKEVAIRNSASQDNLYEVLLADGKFEIESLIVTPELDEFGHKIISRIRGSSFQQLTDTDKRELAIYLVCLEARHPDTLEKMNIREELDKMRESMKATTGHSHKNIDEVLDYFKASPSIGVMSFAWFVQNERSGYLGKPFSDGLVQSNAVEYKFDSDYLITSDFPCFRMGDYLGQFLYVAALSPRKAMIYSPNPDIRVFDVLPMQARADLINLYVLGYAERAFGNTASFGPFVEQHLGWARRCHTTEEKKAYVANFLKVSLTQHGIA